MTTPDMIWLTGITARAHHGVFDFEREQGQVFMFDIGIEVDTRAAARSDSLEDTTNYAEVAAALHGILTAGPVDLIETVAERMAAKALNFPGVRAATVVLHKPEAPVGLPFADVSLTIHRTALTVVPPEPVQVVLGLGGNVGDVRAALTAAVAGLSADLDDLRIGPLVETAAMVLPDSDPQRNYLNTVVSGQTRLSARELLERAHHLEQAAGRRREVRWGPRTLDIDLLAYGDLTSTDPALTLPHPGIAERPFVVVPWAALEPDRALGGTTLSAAAATMRPVILASTQDWA